MESRIFCEIWRKAYNQTRENYTRRSAILNPRPRSSQTHQLKRHSPSAYPFKIPKGFNPAHDLKRKPRAIHSTFRLHMSGHLPNDALLCISRSRHFNRKVHFHLPNLFIRILKILHCPKTKYRHAQHNDRPLLPSHTSISQQPLHPSWNSLHRHDAQPAQRFIPWIHTMKNHRWNWEKGKEQFSVWRVAELPCERMGLGVWRYRKYAIVVWIYD